MDAVEGVLTWRLRVGRVAGVDVFLHWTLLGLVAWVGWTFRDDLTLGALLLAVLFASVFLHELGHCWGARRMGGEAREVVLWPLGGLAMVNVPMAPWPQFFQVAAGPAVNLALAALAAAAFVPLGGGWSWAAPGPVDGPLVLRLLLHVNLALFLFNVIPAWPMDGGRLLQTALWPRLGFHRAMGVAIVTALVCAALLALAAIATWPDHRLVLMVAVLVAVSSLQEREKLRYGLYDELLVPPWALGHGATEPYVPERQPGPLSRWFEARRARRAEAAAQERVAVRERLDEVLAKVTAVGLDGLTKDERRFLDHASRLLREEQQQKAG